MRVRHSIPFATLVPAAVAVAAATAAAQTRPAVSRLSPNPAPSGAVISVDGVGFDAPTLIVVLKNNDTHAQMSSYSLRRYLGRLSGTHFDVPLSSSYYSVAPGSYTLHVETMDANGARSFGQVDVPVTVSAGSTVAVGSAGVPTPPPAPRPSPVPGAAASVQFAPHMAILTDDGRCLYGSPGAMGAGACTMTSAVFTANYNTANYFTISHNDGSCVTAGSAAGQPATLAPCRATATQRFYFNPSGQMQVVGTNLCLDLSGGQRNVSYRVTTWNCDLNPNLAARAWNQRFVMALLAPVAPLRAAGLAVPPAFNSSTSLTATVMNTGARVIAAGGGNLIGNAGGTVIAAGGANVIAAGGANVIAAGGGNVVAYTAELPQPGR